MSARFLRALRAAEADRFAPLVGVLLGAAGGAVYWLGAELWPSNVAVILSMAATALLTTEFGDLKPATRIDVLSRVFCLLIKYNALMSLSAAKLPFVVPAHLALGVIMICGHAASFALAVSAARIANRSLLVALLLGFAPALLLGIPGLIGLAGALIAGLSAVAVLRFRHGAASRGVLNMIQWLTEACFYLGVLAAWGFV